MNSFVRVFATFLLTCMISIQCVLGLSINTVSNQSGLSVPAVQEQETNSLFSVATVSQGDVSYTYANTAIQIPKLTSESREIEGVVYSDRSLFSKRVSFVI